MLAAISLVLSLAGVVRAQSYDSALLDGVAARDRAFETGSERDWQRALQHFARAAEIEPTKEAQFELAEAAAHLGLTARAYAAYQVALSLGLQGKARARAQEFLSAQQAQIARLDVVGPSGALLWVNEQRLGPLPLAAPLVVTPGELRVRLERAGFRSRELRVPAAPAGLVRIELALEPAPALVTAAAASAEPDADSKAWARPTLIAGSALALAGAATFTVSSVLLADARRDLGVSCDQRDPADGDRCLAAAPVRRSDAQAAANRVLTYGNLRWVGVGGAAVGVIAGVVGLVGLASADAPEPARAQLELSPERAALLWRGRF